MVLSWGDIFTDDTVGSFPVYETSKATAEECKKFFTDGDRPAGKIVATFMKRDAEFRSIDWSCDGLRFAAGTRDGFLMVQDTSRFDQGHRRYPPLLEVQVAEGRHTTEVSNIRWHPSDPNILASICGDKVSVWDMRNKASDGAMKTANIVTTDGKSAGYGLNLRWHPTLPFLFIGTAEDWMAVFDTRSEKSLECIVLHKFSCVMNEFEISPSGKQLFACTENGTVDVFEVGQKEGVDPGIHPQQRRTSLQCHSSSVFTIDIDPMDRIMAVGSADSVVHILTLGDFKTMGCFAKCRDEIRSVSFNYNGEMLAVAAKRELYILHTFTRKVIHRMLDPPPGVMYYAVRWHPKKNILMYCTEGGQDNGSVHFWLPNSESIRDK